MSAPASCGGEVEVCPACGQTAVVPAASVPKKTVPAWMLNKWVLIGSAPVVGLLVIALIITFIDRREGLFPPRAEVAELLEKKGYYPKNAEGDQQIRSGRTVQVFSYVRDARPEMEMFSRIDLWCPADDPSKVVAMMSAWPGEVVLDEPSIKDNPVGYLKTAFDQFGFALHGERVQFFVEELSLIKYTWHDVEASRKGATEEVTGFDRERSGFKMEFRQQRDGQKADGKPRYTTWVFLRDKSW